MAGQERHILPKDPGASRSPLPVLLTSMRDAEDDEDDYELKAVKFVGIIFDKDEYKKGEAELNGFLEKGYKVIKDFQTSSGIVVSLGKYENRRCDDES
jgi:hypothetical protein